MKKLKKKIIIIAKISKFNENKRIEALSFLVSYVNSLIFYLFVIYVILLIHLIEILILYCKNKRIKTKEIINAYNLFLIEN